MLTSLGEILKRDLRLAIRHGAESATAVMFFILAVSLFPFGVGPEPAILQQIAAGVIWVAALFAATLSLERLFQADYEDGSLELVAMSPLPLTGTVAMKIAAHWLTTGLPLAISSPLLALLLQLPMQAIPTLILALLIGTPVLSLIGAVGAALTLGARRGGVLVALIVLPLKIPVLIFGVAAVEASIDGYAVAPHLMFLGAMLCAATATGPWVAAIAIRSALEAG
jgi:heme exporter protein B